MKPKPFSFRRSLAVIALCLGLFGAHAPVAWTPEAAAPRGYLLIVGGGDTPPEVQSRFLALAGGAGRARVAVFPMASTSGDEEAVEVAAELQAIGQLAATHRLKEARRRSTAEQRGIDDRFAALRTLR